MVRVLADIPVTIDADALMTRLRIEPETEDAREFAALLARAQAIARPKAIYREAFVEDRDGHAVRIDGIVFTSRMLRHHLDKADRVFAYLATCGTEVCGVRLPPGDMLQEYWLDAVKQDLLWQACRFLDEHLTRVFRLGKTSTMSPGSGDVSVWPIEQQRELFRLFGISAADIGVILTDSCLMIPNKTVSGLRFQAERDFRTCQVCRRESCPSRGAPFDEAMWNSLQHP